jgi:hypothetical protein
MMMIERVGVVRGDAPLNGSIAYRCTYRTIGSIICHPKPP